MAHFTPDPRDLAAPLPLTDKCLVSDGPTIRLDVAILLHATSANGRQITFTVAAPLNPNHHQQPQLKHNKNTS